MMVQSKPAGDAKRSREKLALVLHARYCVAFLLFIGKIKRKNTLLNSLYIFRFTTTLHDSTT